jgi:predicted Fe-Mo cluster-binding NifX family protein
MKIAVSSQGETLDAPASPVFGRCPTYLFVEPETMAFEAVPNPAMSQGGGAGIQAAQFVVNQGASAVLSGNLGPNAFDVLQAAGVPGYLVSEGTVRQAVEAYKAGQLQPMAGPNVRAHAGMRGGGGMGRRQQATAPKPGVDKEKELAELREMLKGLRQQLATTMEKIEALEKED